MIFFKNKNVNTGLFLLIASYAYIFFVTLSYESAWMQPEIFGTKNSIVSMMHYENDLLWPLKYIFRFYDFDPDLISRSTRIFSHLFEIADTVFRVQLWKIILPHPSLSLTFIFTLFLTPYCLYKLLRNWALNDNQAKIAVSFYLVQPGTLSLIAMYFRPAKAMAIFFLILSCLIASDILKRNLSHGKHAYISLVFLFISLTTGFLFDETAVIFYFVFFILFYRFIIRSKRMFITFASIPVIIAVLYFYIIPSITVLLYSFHSDLSGCIGQLFNSNFSPLLFIHNLPGNFRAIFEDSWGLYRPGTAPSLAFNIFFAAQYLILTVTLIYFCMTVFQQIRNHSFKLNKYEILIKAVIVVLWGALAHAFLMNILSNKVWGPYWYGSYMGIFFAILIAGFYKIQNQKFQQLVSIAAASTIVISMLTFPYLNFAYKKYHYYPPIPLYMQKVFEREINRFEINKSDVPREIKEAIEQIVLINRSKKIPDKIKVIPELVWLPVELGWLQKKLIQDNKFIFDANTEVIKYQYMQRQGHQP